MYSSQGIYKLLLRFSNFIIIMMINININMLNQKDGVGDI